MSDPRAIKKARASLRRDARQLLRRRFQTRRCFWTWPWGHQFDKVVDGGRRCIDCGKPLGLDWPVSMDEYEILRVLDDSGRVASTELEPLWDRWRALP